MSSTCKLEKKHTDRERWICIYPAYINSKKTIAEGRRIPKDRCVENPTYHEIRDILDSTGFNVGVENKIYPREMNHDNIIYRGRIRVQMRNEDGSLIKPEFPTRTSILIHICGMIPKLKSRSQKQGSSDQNHNPQSAAKKNKGKKGKR